MVPVLYILIGLPASGKSTWAENHKHLVHISSDKIREELWGDAEDQQHPEKVFEKMFKDTVSALRAGFDVCYDATNLVAKRRINLIKEIEKIVDAWIMGVVFATPFEVCIERDKARPRHVGYGVLKRMYKSFQMPMLEEGFDDLEVVRDLSLLESMVYDEDYFKRKVLALDMVPHDNPHHSYSIGEHCVVAQSWVKAHWKEISDDVGYYLANCVRKAALYHDEGKAFAKTFKDAKGNDSEIAHYYGHECCGAYDCLAYDIDDKMVIAVLVTYHMAFFKGDKYLEKVKALLGDKMFKALEWLHKADLAAH